MSAIISTSTTLRVIPRLDYEFSTLHDDGFTYIPLGVHIDISPFQEVDLVVRVHTVNIASGAKITVFASADGFTMEDPTTSFFAMAPATPPGGSAPPNYGAVLLDSTTTAGAYLVTTLAGPLGRLIAVFLNPHQKSDSRVAITASISVDLVMKGGDPSGIAMAYNTYRGYR
jgi:hypothetical protein